MIVEVGLGLLLGGQLVDGQELAQCLFQSCDGWTGPYREVGK